MIALDTNVLVRYLVADDAAQSARAAKRIATARRTGEPLFVSWVVVCELAWVLSVAYKTPKRELITVLRSLLSTRQLAFERDDQIESALDAYEVGGGDFADYVIRAAALAHGCDTVLTFDKAHLKESGFDSA
jgi:predicted nucleic-acid-binding protein